MRIQNVVTQVLLPVAVFVVMFGLGTSLTLADLRRVLRRPGGFLLGVVAHALFLPLLAFGVAWVLRLPSDLAVGLVLIASCPANASANILTHLARGDTMLSVCLTAVASLTSVLSVPLFVNVALGLFPAEPSAARLPVVASALWLLVVSTVPVIGGMLLRWRRPAAARAVEARMGVLGLAVIVFVVAAAVWSLKDEVVPALGRAGGPALLLNVLSFSVAWGSAALLGLDVAQRIAIGLECGLQNFAMAAFIALTLLSDPPLLVPGIAYGLGMWLSAAAVVFLVRRRRAGGQPGFDASAGELTSPEGRVGLKP